MNSIYTVTKLRDQGYEIGITEFITAKNMAEVLNRMRTSTDDAPLELNLNEEEHYFEMLNDTHKKDTIECVKLTISILGHAHGDLLDRYCSRLYRTSRRKVTQLEIQL